MDEEIHRLIYISRALPVPGGAISFLEKARAYNEHAGITGVLLRYMDRYLQYLEGPAPAVQTCFARIKLDPRHEDIVLLFNLPGHGRYFSQWSMRLLAVTPPYAGLARRFFGPEGNPSQPYCPYTGFELLYRLALD